MRARDLLPYRELTIDTSWSPEVAVIELRKRVGKKGWLGGRADGGAEPFLGDQVDAHTLRFTRAIRYRNSFLPVIVAAVSPLGDIGSRVRVTMALNPFVVVFMGVWMTGATVGGVSIAIATLSERNPAGLLALGFPLFGVGLCCLPFAIEARIAERELRGVFARGLVR